jgi:hypothetical protein
MAGPEQAVKINNPEVNNKLLPKFKSEVQFLKN